MTRPSADSSEVTGVLLPSGTARLGIPPSVLAALGYFSLALAAHILLLVRPRDVPVIVSFQGCAQGAVLDALRLAFVDGVLWCYLGSRLVRSAVPFLSCVIFVGRAYLPVGVVGVLVSVLFVALAAPSESEQVLNASAALYALIPLLAFLRALFRVRMAFSLPISRLSLMFFWLIAVRVGAYAYIPNATDILYKQVLRSHRSVFSD